MQCLQQSKLYLRQKIALKHLFTLNKYFYKYRYRFLLGILFIIFSNYFRILAPQISGYVIDEVVHTINQTAITVQQSASAHKRYDFLVQQFIHFFQQQQLSLANITIYAAFILLVLAILGGFFMFLMRQTIIVMSRHIEYDQKNEVYQHYQQLNLAFFKQNRTGDLMNRISEDVSRVRMYTGPAVMYVINLSATIGFSLFFMAKQNWQLTLYVLAPLPVLAIVIYNVNTIIHRRSEKIQEQLSALTTTAQETYSGIRVIKSFVQEKAMAVFFEENSEQYKKNALSMAKLEAVYFPSIALLIGISTLLTIAIGGWFAYTKQQGVTAGTIAEFVIYVNLLTFPVSAIGWTASMIQRAAASQKRLNEFLDIQPEITSPANAIPTTFDTDIHFNNISFTYQHTQIKAINQLNLTIKKGEKVLILGRTGSGKSTLLQLLLRFYDVDEGSILFDTTDIQSINLQALRNAVSFVPQDVFLFSDTVANNIAFGLAEKPTTEAIENAAKFASIHNEISQFEKGYETIIGERGVTLSGGQKQRLAIARSIIKKPDLLIFDDCLSAVDANTEKQITNHIQEKLSGKTAIMVSHRIFTGIQFHKIIVMDKGSIVEEGNHQSLMALNGLYTELYQLQRVQN